MVDYSRSRKINIFISGGLMSVKFRLFAGEGGRLIIMVVKLR